MNDDAVLYMDEHGDIEEPTDLKPCKHLNHDKDAYPRCELRTEGEITYWYRPYETQNQRCQFCKKRHQRINEYLDCYEPGYCNDYVVRE